MFSSWHKGMKFVFFYAKHPIEIFFFFLYKDMFYIPKEVQYSTLNIYKYIYIYVKNIK